MGLGQQQHANRGPRSYSLADGGFFKMSFYLPLLIFGYAFLLGGTDRGRWGCCTNGTAELLTRTIKSTAPAGGGCTDNHCIAVKH